jgi:hypothetical protein
MAGRPARAIVSDQFPVQQLERFADIGLEHILDHRPVDHRAVLAHEIGGCGGAHEQQHQ